MPRTDFVADVGDEFGFEPRGFQGAHFPRVGVDAGITQTFALDINPVEFRDAPAGHDADHDHARKHDQ
jgi:hypothetical protein